MNKEPIILVGGGGHCRSAIDVIETEDRFAVAGIVDLPAKQGETILGYPVIAVDSDLPRLVAEFGNVLITLGQIKDPLPRMRLFERIKELGGRLPAIVSPLAHVSRHAAVGEGTIVMHHSLINAGASVGRNCIINSKALIEHDATIGDHCHISTACVINGGTRVAAGTFVGSNAVTREAVAIGAQVIVGGGVAVLEDVPDGKRYTGRDRSKCR